MLDILTKAKRQRMKRQRAITSRSLSHIERSFVSLAHTSNFL